MYAAGQSVQRDEARAIQLLHRACDGDVVDACRDLAQRYEQGRGVERNPARAAELMRRAPQLPGGSGSGNSPTEPAGGVAGGIGNQPPPPPPPPKAVAPVRVGGAIKQPVQTKKVEAVYPSIAQKQRVQGIVIVELVIGPEGKVTAAKILRSVPLLDQAAIDAVRQWEFTPTVVDGTPVPLVLTVTVNFTLDDGRGRARSLPPPTDARGRGRR
jgi:protein TonB